MRLWIAVCLALPHISAQSTAPSTAAAKKIRLEGRVASINGEAVRKASVRLQLAVQNGQQQAGYVEVSDKDGKFLFDNVAPGRYTLTAEKTGFVPGRYGARTITAPAALLNIADGDQLTNLVIQLTPHGVITGKVLDPDGDPLEHTQITVMRLGYRHGRRDLVSAGATSTDDQGNFRLANLTPGRYFLSAQDRDSVTFGREERPGRAGAANEGYPLTYYPGVVDASSASPIDVAAGAEIGAQIQLRKSRLFAIRGKVIDSTAPAPPGNLPILALPKDMAGASVNMLISRALQQSRPDGSFEIRNLSPGAYVLKNLTSFSSGGGAANRLTGRLEVAIADADVDGVTLLLGPGAELNGSVKFERSGVSSPAVNVPGQRPHIELLPEDTSTLGTPTAQIRDDGTFQIKGVPAARFFVNVAPVPEGIYVKAVRMASVDLAREALDLISGAGGTIEVVLAPNAADVSGTLRNSAGEAMTGISVTLWPKDLSAGSPWILVHRAVTDQNGGFKFGGLAPGNYEAAAWDDVEDGLLENADFLAHFSSDAATVKLEEGSHETASLKLIPRDKTAIEAAKIQ